MPDFYAPRGGGGGTLPLTEAVLKGDGAGGAEAANTATTSTLLLASVEVDLNDGDPQTLYAVPEDTRCIITAIQVRDMSAAAVEGVASGTIGWDAGNHFGTGGVLFGFAANFNDPTKTAAWTLPAIVIRGEPESLLQFIGASIGEAITVTFDVFGYLVDATIGVPIPNVVAP